MISVVIPTFGRPKHLERAINSVTNQTVQDWEIIVVDDNNPNTQDRLETEKLLSRLMTRDSRINYVQHPSNMNGAAARNTGLKHAKGEYIVFLDDDDEFSRNRFQECLDALSQCDNSFAGAYTGCIFYHKDKIYRTISTAKSGNFLVKTLATTFQSHSGSNFFLKTDIVRDLGGFDSCFIRHQDYEFLVRLFEKYNICGISKPLMKKYEYGNNIPNLEKFIKVKQLYLKKFEQIIDMLPNSDKKYIYHSQYTSLTIMAIENRNWSLFRYYFRLAISYHFFSFVDLLRMLKALK